MIHVSTIAMAAGTKRSRPRLGVAVIVLVTSALVGGLGVSAGAAGASAASAASKCSGTPIRFGFIGVITSNNPSVPSDTNGASPFLAAQKAVNRDCTAGVPIKVTVCDSHGEPNAATACARQGVDEHWVAWVGDGISGGQTFPILSAAGIPELGGYGFSAVEPTSPLWFPFAGGIYQVLADVAIAANAHDPAKASLAIIDNPAIDTITGLFKKQMEAAGGTYGGTIAVPSTATDMSQYAAQALSSGINALAAGLSGDQADGMMQQLVQQGADFEKKFALIGTGGAVTDKDIEQLGAAVKGIWGTHYTLVTDKKNPATKQYIKELKAAKQPVTDHGNVKTLWDQPFENWSWVHIVAKLLADAPTKDAATLVEKLNTGGPISSPGMPTVDFAVNPFASDPFLKAIRVFNPDFAATRTNAKGKEVLVTDGFIPIGSKFTAKKLA
jgi:ABC-type branched-subunit amino acid transport system substrate-binding protein